MFALGVYLGHVALEHVFANNSVLLQMICELLNEEKLKVAAADCLLVFVERRRVRTEIQTQFYSVIQCILYIAALIKLG